MLSDEQAIALFDAELKPDQLERCSETDCWYQVLKSELLSYTRKVEQAARAELLAGVELPEPDHYKSTTPCYTADQLAAAVAKAKAEQREADAKVCEGYAMRTRGYLDDDMTACKLADAIRKGE